MALYRRVLRTSPGSFEANSEAGVALDLLGQHADARTHFAKAIEVASSPQQKARARRSMAISYAFENDCRRAARFESAVYQTYFDGNDFRNAAEVATELADICIEARELDVAYTWYHAGHEVAFRERDLEPARQQLWNFRWEHAQARIAARRDHASPEAQSHIAAAKAIVDQSANTELVPLFAYLIGYVAFFGDDYAIALSKLQEAGDRDSSVLSLIAQAYEKLGDTARAGDYYRKVLAASNAHNPSAASARSLARKRLESL